MKRGGYLKRKRSTPRAYEDTTLRRMYADENKQDELLRLFPLEGGLARVQIGNIVHWLPAYDTDAAEIHHVCGGANGADRWDLVTNLIAVSAVTHAWLERYRADGFYLCMKAKIVKGEWDDEVMRETVLGLRRPGASVLSYLRLHGPYWEWVKPTVEWLIQWEERR